MLFFKQIIGRTGEQEAARFLKKKGLKIVQMNYKNQIGEIDIIAKENLNRLRFSRTGGGL